MIAPYKLQLRPVQWIPYFCLFLGAIVGNAVASEDNPRIFITIGLLVIFIFLGITSPKNLFLFLILLLPYQRFLGQFSEPLFKGTGFFLEIRSIINIFVIIYSAILFYIHRDRIGRLSDYIVAIPLLINLINMLLSSAYSPEPLYSLRAFFRLGMPFFCYFLPLMIPLTQQDIEKIFKMALIASVIQLIWGLTDPFLLPQPEGEPYIRSEATLGHPNAFAAYLAMCFYLFTFLKARSNRKLWSSLNSLLYLGVLFIDVVLTIARSSWIALLLSIAAARKLFKLSILSLGIVLLLLAGLIIAGPLWQRIEWRVVEERGNVAGRVNLNEYGWYLFKQKPIIGHGNSAYALNSRQHFGAQFAQVQIEGLGIAVGSNPHNEYMDVLVGRGLVGVAIFAWLLFSVAGLANRLSNSKDIWTSSYGFMLMGILTFVVTLSFFDAGFDYTGIWFWSFVGVGDLAYRKMRLEINNHSLK